MLRGPIGSRNLYALGEFLLGTWTPGGYDEYRLNSDASSRHIAFAPKGTRDLLGRNAHPADRRRRPACHAIALCAPSNAVISVAVAHSAQRDVGRGPLERGVFITLPGRSQVVDVVLGWAQQGWAQQRHRRIPECTSRGCGHQFLNS